MFWTQPNQSVFRLILTWTGDLKTGNNAGAFYVGVGDRFDDDRRFAREDDTGVRPRGVQG